MIRIGDYNTLKVIRSTSVGVFLGDEEGTEVLLPNKYVPTDVALERLLTVFCYLDHEERPVATTLKPKIIRDGFATLEVAQVNKIGAFLDWGLEKQLFVPFKEQQTPMEEGGQYVVHCFLDERSFRLLATTKLDRFLNKDTKGYVTNKPVNLLPYRKTNLGWEVVVDQRAKGLLFFSDQHGEIALGTNYSGYIRKVREDGKLDVSLQPTGVQMLEVAANRIMKELENSGGFLFLHDQSTPQDIKGLLQMSKKSFKKGIGVLYKQGKIELVPNGIKLKP